jgi:hypothetical protein
MAAADGDEVADGAAGPDGEAVADPPATRGGAQIHIPLPTGAGPFRAGTRGVGGGVAGTGVVLPVEAWGAAGRTPGRLWRGWGTSRVAAVEGAVGEDPDDGRLGAGGAVVLGGDGDGSGGEVVPVGLEGTGVVGGVERGGGLEGGGGVGGQAFPAVTVTSRRVRFTLAAHVHKLHAPPPCPTTAAPLPLTVMGLVATGRPLAPVEVPSIGTV